MERRGARIRAEVRKIYMPDDVKLLPKNQRNTIKERCDQVPVLGFNCGSNDLNLNKEHFAERPADTAPKSEWGKMEKQSCSFSLRSSVFFILLTALVQELATTIGLRRMDVPMRNRGSRTSG